ncbi:hypothetical protein IAT38_006059 [Cryptococcus sp. DSM 104549]
MWVICARHGQTQDNVDGIIQGHKDTPLNDYGRFEASRLAERLSKYPITEAWSSPLSRARETAEIVLKHHGSLELNLHDGLKERGLGSMEGRRRARNERAPADAEGYDALSARSKVWFDELLVAHEPEAPLPSHSSILDRLSRNSHPHPPSSNTNSKQPPEPLVLVVSHGAWLANFLRLVLSPAYGFKVPRGVDLEARCLNTSVMMVWCEMKNGKWKGSVESWGDVRHLKDVMEREVKDVTDDVR